MRSLHVKSAAICASILLASCSFEPMRVTLAATDAASTVFKQMHDEARIARDSKASRRLGELCGSVQLAKADVQPLKRIVADAKADGTVTAEEADHILVEMERIVELYRGR